MLTVHVSSGFGILVFMFLKYVFFLCSSLMRFFVVHFFFHFPGQCVASNEVLMSFVALIINSAGLAIVAGTDLRCDDFFPMKVIVTNW